MGPQSLQSLGSLPVIHGGIIGDFEHQTDGHRLTHVLRTLEVSAKIPVLRVEREVAVEVAGYGWSLDLC